MSAARTALSIIVAAAILAACGESARIPIQRTSPAQASPTQAAVDPSPSPGAEPRPRQQLPQGFTDLSDVDSTILLDIRYHTGHNFAGRRIDGYLQARCLLTERAAQALHRVQESARAKGFSLKVYDCYRPLRAGADFAAWAKTPDAQMKAEFFPGLSKQALFSNGYVSGGRSPHSRGSAVDLTLVALPPREQRAFVPGEPLTSCTAPVEQRFPDNTIDMGTGYDCFDTRSHTLDGRVSTAARANRLLLRQLMTDAGFRNYAKEWWHYGLAAEPYPDAYFDFPVGTGSG
jgi:D-alanyl-D-alanine dipeptidase